METGGLDEQSTLFIEAGQRPDLCGHTSPPPKEQ